LSSSGRSKDPPLTPTRSGIPRPFTALMTSSTFHQAPMLPGLMRTQSTISAAFKANRWSKWMSAMSGTVIAALMRGSAAAASSSGTATRISSHPAASSCRICSTVVVTSLVSVEHIDWTETGPSPRIFLSPRRICLVGRRVMCIEQSGRLTALLVPVRQVIDRCGEEFRLVGSDWALRDQFFHATVYAIGGQSVPFPQKVLGALLDVPVRKPDDLSLAGQAGCDQD